MQNIPSTKMTGSCHLTSPSSLPRWCAALIVLAALLLDIGLASAQQQISTASKTLSGTYNFSAVGTWASGGIPTNGNPAGFVQIILDNGGNGGVAYNNDIPFITNNSLTIAGTAGQSFHTIPSNLYFDGPNAAITINNPGGFSIGSGTLYLNTNILISGSVAGQARINGPFRDSGGAPAVPHGVAYNRPNGFITPRSSSVNWTGPFDFQAGRLQLFDGQAAGSAIYPLGNGGLFTIGDSTFVECTATAGILCTNLGNNPIKINGNFTFGGTVGANLGNGAVTLGTAAGTSRTITVSNANPNFIFGGGIANGTTATDLIKAGPGTLTLNGTNTYTGATTVSGGTLNLRTTSYGHTSISTADGATLGVTVASAGNSLTNTSLTLGTSAASTLTLNLGNGNPTAVVITNTGNLTLNGPVTVNVTGTGLTATPIVLLTYGGSLAGSGSFVAGTLPVVANFTPSLLHDTVNKQLKLVFSYTPQVSWAVGNGIWDTTTLNWTNAFSANLLTNYNEFAQVLLDDTATGTSPIQINLTTTRTPGVVTNNSTKNYTLTGSGIAGTAALVKLGSSTLTLANANTYTGGTTISAGTLQLGDGATVNGSVAGNIADNSVLAVANPSAQTISSIISGTGSLTKSGAGTLTLASVSTYSGGTLVSAGTLQLGDGATINGSVAGIITNNNALAVANPNTQTITNIIKGSGSLTKSGAGALTLTGANTYSGATTVTGGTLTVNTVSTGAGSFTVANGNTLAVTVAGAGTSLTNSSLTLGTSAATTLNFNLGTGNPTAPLMVDTGALTLGGIVTVNVTGNTLTTGTVVLMSYGSGGAGTFVAGSLPAVAGNSASLVKDTVNKQLKLVFAPLQTVVWQSPNSSDVWDLTTANWTNAVSGNSLTTYFENSPVRFDDTAPAGSPIFVNLDTNHFPGNITVTNSALTYVVGGAGIGGVASLTKSGSGLLRLDNSNSYSGGTLVSDGTLTLNNGSFGAALGSPLTSTLVTITNTGSLNLNLNAFTNAAQTAVIGGFGLDSAHGAIYADPGETFYRGTFPLTGVRNLSLASDSAIGGPGSSISGIFSLGISTQGQENPSNYVGKLQGNGHSLTVIGGAQVVVFATNATPFSQLVVAAGSVMFERTAYGNTPFGANCPFVISNNAYITTWDLVGPLPYGLTFSNNITIGSGGGDGGQIWDDSRQFVGNACADNYNGTITLNGPLTLNNISSYYGNPNNVPTTGTQTFNGVISGTNGYGITMTGPSIQYSNINNTVYFNGTNTYNGPTELQNYLTLFTTTLNQGGGSYLIDDNAVLDVLPKGVSPTLPTASLTIGSSGGAQLSMARMSGLPATPVVYATNLTINGSSTIALPSVTLWSVGTFHLIKYEGVVGGAGVAGLSIANLPAGVSATLVDNTGNQTVDLVVSDLSGLTWLGNVDTNWDIGITPNWIANNVSTTYADGTLVTFGNGATNFNVNFAANVAPLVMNANSASNYVFGGTFNLAGSGTLVKSGAGVLAISNANTYTGGTIINAGEVDLGNNTALGTGLITMNGGNLRRIGGGTIVNNLSIVGTCSLGGSAAEVWTGNVNLNGAVQTITNVTFNQFNGLVSNGGIRLEKPPGFQYGFWLANAANSYAGGTFLDGPQLDISAVGVLGAGPLEIVSSSWLVLESANLDVSGKLKIDDGANLSVDTSTFSTTFTNAWACGPLATAALTKLNTGTLTLLAVNTNNGSTTISAGTLALSGTGGLPNTSLISIASGATFDVSGLTSTFGLGFSQTLSNNASATGTVNGSLNAASGTVSVSYTNGTPSLTVANGTLTLAAGTVFKISNTGTTLPSGTYKIISKGTAGLVAGTAPSAVTLVGSAGTSSLSISNNELYLVVVATAPSPTILSPYLDGSNQLVLRVATQLGYNYALLSTTNLNPPVVWSTNSTTAGTGGNITNTVPVGSVPAQQFFRYQVQ